VWLGAELVRLLVGLLQFGRSGPQKVKLDGVEAIELAEVGTIGNVIGNMIQRVAIIVALVLLLAACATQPQPLSFWWAPPPGFLYGILHGLISPVALIASLFTDVRIYAYPNSGVGYDFGFMLGADALGTLSRVAAGRT
jgi:hypothetical protein